MKVNMPCRRSCSQNVLCGRFCSFNQQFSFLGNDGKCRLTVPVPVLSELLLSHAQVMTSWHTTDRVQNSPGAHAAFCVKTPCDPWRKDDSTAKGRSDLRVWFQVALHLQTDNASSWMFLWHWSSGTTLVDGCGPFIFPVEICSTRNVTTLQRDKGWINCLHDESAVWSGALLLKKMCI